VSQSDLEAQLLEAVGGLQGALADLSALLDEIVEGAEDNTDNTDKGGNDLVS
jgi:hypothetical protein